jgi:multidrug efflux pump subunit AcrA (membrane-fusion protein)
MKTKKIVVIAIVVLVSAGLVFVPSLLAQRKTPAGGPGGPGRTGGSGTVCTGRTEEAVIRNLQADIEVNGDVVSQEQVTVMPEMGGKLVSVRAVLGAKVRKGELLAQVDPSKPGSQYYLSPVYAPASGVVVSAPASVGSTVTTSTSLLTLGTGGLPEIEALIPEREVGQLRVGLQGEVSLAAFPGEVFHAEITKLSPVVDPASRTKTITLRFDAPERAISPGMFAHIKLNTRAYENVVSIPQDAIIENRGAQAVFVLAGVSEEGQSLARMREVSVGVTVDGETEIKSGLAAGEKVIVQGQQFLTDGAAVRVLGNR